MNKIQGGQFLNSIMNMKNQINENKKYINNLFSKYDIDNDRLLSFEVFYLFFNYYCIIEESLITSIFISSCLLGIKKF